VAIQVRRRPHVPYASHLATVTLAATGAEEEAVGGGCVARNVTDLDHRLHAGALALGAEAEVRTGVEWTATVRRWWWWQEHGVGGGNPFGRDVELKALAKLSSSSIFQFLT